MACQKRRSLSCQTAVRVTLRQLPATSIAPSVAGSRIRVARSAPFHRSDRTRASSHGHAAPRASIAPTLGRNSVRSARMMPAGMMKLLVGSSVMQSQAIPKDADAERAEDAEDAEDAADAEEPGPLTALPNRARTTPRP